MRTRNCHFYKLCENNGEFQPDNGLTSQAVIVGDGSSGGAHPSRCGKQRRSHAPVTTSPHRAERV